MTNIVRISRQFTVPLHNTVAWPAKHFSKCIPEHFCSPSIDQRIKKSARIGQEVKSVRYSGPFFSVELSGVFHATQRDNSEWCEANQEDSDHKGSRECTLHLCLDLVLHNCPALGRNVFPMTSGHVKNIAIASSHKNKWKNIRWYQCNKCIDV